MKTSWLNSATVHEESPLSVTIRRAGFRHAFRHDPAMMRPRTFTTFLLAALVLLPGFNASQAAISPTLSATRDADQLRLSWSPGEAGASYTVEATTALLPPAWQPLGGPAGWPITATQWSGPAPTASATFYRLLVSTSVPRGTVETNILLQRFTSAELLKRIQDRGVPIFTAIAADAWKITYSTIDVRGRPTRASALIVIPQGITKALPLLSYQHGTVTLREDVPSRLNDEADLGLIMGASGYITVLPDYLGLGDSPGLHPYQHAASQATAVVDAIRAARDSLEGKGATWNKQLFLTGYSQGGHATLAVQRELEFRHAEEFPITATAPSAGAYDLSGTTTTDFLSARSQPNPYYFAYVLAAYVEIYGLAPTLADLLKAPYNTTVPPLFDGLHSGGEINAILPARPIDILKPEVLAAFTSDPNHPLRLAIRDNDLHTGWVPRSKTRFYHCAGDLDVLPANSKVAFDTFKAAGATAIELIDPLPFADHGGCAPFALLSTKSWFDSMKQ